MLNRTPTIARLLLTVLSSLHFSHLKDFVAPAKTEGWARRCSRRSASTSIFWRLGADIFIRKGKKELAAVSMWKYPATMDVDLLEAAPHRYVRSDSGNELIVVRNPNASNIETDAANQPKEKSATPKEAEPKPEDGETTYLHGGLGFTAGALKPLAEIRPVADILAFLGDKADRVAVSRDCTTVSTTWRRRTTPLCSALCRC